MSSPIDVYRELARRLANPVIDEAGMCTVGTCNGKLVCVRLNAEAFFITTSVEHWPLDVMMRSPVVARRRTTGDADLDKVVEVAPGNDGWRMVLDAAQRKRLIALGAGRVLLVRRSALNLRLEHADAKSLHAVVDLVCELAASPIARGNGHEDAVFSLAREEPNARVRLGHFVWLVSRRWNVPLVYRIALADADADIRAWAKDNVPAETGAFR